MNYRMNYKYTIKPTDKATGEGIVKELSVLVRMRLAFSDGSEEYYFTTTAAPEDQRIDDIDNGKRYCFQFFAPEITEDNDFALRFLISPEQYGLSWQVIEYKKTLSKGGIEKEVLIDHSEFTELLKADNFTHHTITVSPRFEEIKN